jgi:hypothetical protein|tara:strand:- start:2811 stop:2996 length:186 start_codon:yes stop_codon:yes gene_type:complete
MDSKKKEIIKEISTAMASLAVKLEALQAKVNELCQSTDCHRVKKVNQDLLCKKPTKKKIED